MTTRYILDSRELFGKLGKHSLDTVFIFAQVQSSQRTSGVALSRTPEQYPNQWQNGSHNTANDTNRNTQALRGDEFPRPGESEAKCRLVRS